MIADFLYRGKHGTQSNRSYRRNRGNRTRRGVVVSRMRGRNPAGPARVDGRRGGVSVGLIVFVLLGLAVGGGWFGDRIRTGRQLRDAVERARVADSTLAEQAKDLLQKDSTLGVAFAQNADLETALAEEESGRALIAAELRNANARISSLTQVVAEARSSLTAMANTTETVEGRHTASGELTDGLLSADWIYMEPELALDYSVRLPLEVIQSETGDGRVLVVARSADPRVTLDVPQVFVDPKPPEIIEHIPFMARIKHILYGAAGASVAAWVLR